LLIALVHDEERDDARRADEHGHAQRDLPIHASSIRSLLRATVRATKSTRPRQARAHGHEGRCQSPLQPLMLQSHA
jgi:hypothetical protein